MNRRAWWIAGVLALGGMAGCAGLPEVAIGPDDHAIDRVWLALVRGDLAAAREAQSTIEDPVFAERAQRDVQAAAAGRPTALVDAEDSGSWMAARFDASQERALARLAALDRGGGALSPAMWIEAARRSLDPGRRLSAARAALGASPGGAEALALEIETLLAMGRRSEAIERADAARPDLARLVLVRRRVLAATGRAATAARGLVEDIESDRATPASLALLEELLLQLPLAEEEARVRQLLAARSEAGVYMERARRRLLARLTARAGEGRAALALVEPLAVLTPEEERWVARGRARLGEVEPAGLAAAADVDPERDTGRAVGLMRIAAEWDLAARASYRRFAEDGAAADLDDFLHELGEAASGLPLAPDLASLPRNDYGVLGQMIDSESLRAAWPEAFVLAGRALGLTAEVSWWDAEERIERDLPELGPGGPGYTEVRVRHLRVPGFLASRGASFQGAALDRAVFLDLDEIELEERRHRGRPGPELPPRPAAGAEERRDLLEPLDEVERLYSLVRDQAGEGFGALLVDTVSLHERKHVLDTRDFLARGFAGRLVALVQVGLLPGAVRAELERRAQLHALRESPDPRLPLAQCISYLPVEGSRRNSEHAVGYGILVKQFLAVLDGGDWEGAVPLEQLGLSRQARLLPQLHRLPPETVRAVARAIPD